ncbi:hypothetical protein C2S51_013056 [Perilla frutescens var. frutescens]|nr:hypothetical protein C2S51_013056 [Perilla frutescens var. frutescens]
MEDDSLQRYQHLGTAHHPVKEMESVVATVSGYQGSERFNLIKLIDRTGASYVGNMNQSVTHLVCWKFDGRKYEIAKKFRIAIVNHCWIEECLKQGRRVAEEPYTYRSGKDMGPLVLDILLDINQAKAQSKDLKKSKRPMVDTGLENINDAVWKDSMILDEDLFPTQMQNSHGSSKSTRKVIKRNPRNACPSSSRHGLDTLSTTRIIELEEASTLQCAYSCRLEKRNSTSSKSQSKGRRLVKKHKSVKDWLTASNVEEECEEVKVIPENKSRGVLVDNSEVERHQFTSNRNASNSRTTLIDLENTDVHDTVQKIDHLSDDDIEEIEHVNNENENSHARVAPSSCATSEELHEAANLDSTEKESLLPISNELSCVICWTDFSSTRGVLPCGHRFCFSCIQTWAERTNSRRQPSTCPLCKASFICITKVDDAVSSDQKIYSQSIPNDSLKMDLYILPDETYSRPSNVSAPVCSYCSSREPADLLVSCNLCQIRCIHTYCLDPPLFPWTCVHCKDLQMLFLQNR